MECDGIGAGFAEERESRDRLSLHFCGHGTARGL